MRLLLQKRAAGEANMRSKDRIHAEHLTNRRQGADDEKTPGNKASTIIPRDGWNRACCHNSFPGQEQSNHSEAHITAAASGLLINLESRRINHEPTVPQPAVRGQRGRRSAELRVLPGGSYRSESEKGDSLVVPNAALGRGRDQRAPSPQREKLW